MLQRSHFTQVARICAYGDPHLALGIGAVTSIFSVVNSVLLQPFGFPDPGRLVALREYVAALTPVASTDNARHFLLWQDNAKTLSGMAIFQNGEFSISAGTDYPELVSGMDC